MSAASPAHATCWCRCGSVACLLANSGSQLGTAYIASPGHATCCVQVPSALAHCAPGRWLLSLTAVHTSAQATGSAALLVQHPLFSQAGIGVSGEDCSLASTYNYGSLCRSFSNALLCCAGRHRLQRRGLHAVLPAAGPQLWAHPGGVCAVGGRPHRLLAGALTMAIDIVLCRLSVSVCAVCGRAHRLLAGALRGALRLQGVCGLNPCVHATNKHCTPVICKLVSSSVCSVHHLS